MNVGNEPGPPRRGATPEQLRADIDSGRTGDKVGGFDPAAAPLCSDDEAGGVQLDPELIAAMCAQECAKAPKPSTRQNGATPELAPDGDGVRTPYVWPIAAGVLGAVVLAGVILLLV
jgi:hypothetical protein